jgi:endonuclease/exonuclease/phosphatase (EEP) superfamily protein YafD
MATADPPPPPQPALCSAPSSRIQFETVVRFWFRALAAICALALSGLYLGVGDLTPWGEYFTIWPPVLWLLGLVPLAALGTARSAKRTSAMAWAAVAAFALLTNEITPLVRSLTPAPKIKGDLRAVTWNVGGSSDLGAVVRDLRELEPDICILQECRSILGRENLARLATLWPEMKAERSGELITLSRHPIKVLPTHGIGPWSDPQLMRIELTGGHSLLLANIRLMLPSLVLVPWPRGTRQVMARENAQRVAQFPKLATLIAETAEREKPDAILFGGDFNTSSHARSLDPIRKMFQDAWRIAGRGWGGTCTTQFPVSRIDAIHSSKALIAVRAEVGKSAASDHRPLVVDLKWAVPHCH